MLEKKHDKYGFPIKIYLSDPKDYTKNSIVERFNRTHRRSTVVYKEQNNNTPLTRANIAHIAESYNNDLHSTIKAKPKIVYDLRDKNTHKYKFIDLRNHLKEARQTDDETNKKELAERLKVTPTKSPSDGENGKTT